LIGLIDLTTLEGTDNKASVEALAGLAKQTHARNDIPGVAALCVYPTMVHDAWMATRETGIPIAAVAGGFPSGQTFIEIKVGEVMQAIAAGASEIDIVISRGALLEGDYRKVFDEIKALKTVAGEVHVKVILETCELPEVGQVRMASVLALLAGADFLKTSTGKGKAGASLASFLVMADAIREYYLETGKMVGIKAAGGIRTAQDALPYYVLVHQILGEEWVVPSRFRIGASSLLRNLLDEIS
jgi:deoxyribose-phosphate aldolase